MKQVPCTVTYSADKAGIMPGVSQGVQELVPSLDWELAAMTTSSKQSVEIYKERC